MKTKITPDQFFKLFGEMFAGMSVPGSIPGILGAAREPWGELKSKLRLMGWNEANECEQAAREVFKPILKSAEIALAYFEQCVMTCDPDEDEPKEAAMLRDAINSFYERKITR